MREYAYNKQKNYTEETLTPEEKLMLLKCFIDHCVYWCLCPDQKKYVRVETPLGSFYNIMEFEQLLFTCEVHKKYQSCL